MSVQVNVPTTDNVQPIYDENAPWRIWGIDDIYLGLEGKNRYVPKVNDYVRRPQTYETWIVKSIDPHTYIPKLEAISAFGANGDSTREDVLFGVGPGSQAQLLRIYINRANYPYKATVDTHCFVGGMFVAYAVIYKNGDPSIGGEPISRLYDSSGNFMGVKIPLEVVALDTHTNHSIKVVQEFSVTEDIPDGEPLLVIFYTSDGNPVSKSMLLVENTSYIRGLDIQRKFVTSISLESPWLSASDSNVLQFPLNIPLNALDLVGVVNYNVGPALKLPVDGGKFRMDGLDGYISSIPGEKFDLSLVYNLSENEIAYAGQGVYVDRKVTQAYSVITEIVEPGYTVKLFVYPIWDAILDGYRLRYWLYNLARNSYTDVTEFIAYNSDLPAFDPRGYGFKQRLQVNLNLRKVSMAFKPMIHTQMFEVTLFSEPQDNVTPWVVASQLSPNVIGFGRATYVTRVEANKFTLRSGFETKQDWLKAFYYDADPLIDRRSEVKAPEPTSMYVSTNNGTTWTKYFIDTTWNMTLNSATNMEYYKSILIRFVRPSGINEMELAMAAVVIRP